MSSRSWLTALLAVSGVCIAWTARSGTVRDDLARLDDAAFPHRRHARLFPTCQGCHAGIVTGDSASMFPPPTLCARCHDGQIERVVSWSGPSVTPTNLRFSHSRHGRGALRRGDTITCEQCHALGNTRRVGGVDSTLAAPGPAGRQWMAVGAARPTACLACHAHQASGHLADDNACSRCHLQLVDARAVPEQVIATFPRPASHRQPGFLSAHAPRSDADESRCATCHARDSCERCHVNAAMLPAIVRLRPDARVAHLIAGKPAVYPVPASHREALWAQNHGRTAERDIASCANCHAQPSCVACHIGRGAAKQIAALPLPGKAPGVRLQHVETDPRAHTPEPRGHRPLPDDDGIRVWQARTVAPSLAVADTGDRRSADTVRAPLDSGRVHLVHVHPQNFIMTHRVAAAAQQLTCSNCHEQRFCTSCHDGQSRRSFHPANFIARHAVEAYGRESDCTRCHSPEAFCRTCHLNVGLATRAPHNAAFHTGQPLWLLQHGQAARQSLESCTTCHQQRDCLRCHSTAGQRVNPHGPDFDPRRMQQKNPQMCLQCHLSNPLSK